MEDGDAVPILMQSNVLDDPGRGKRTKNQWYSTTEYGTVRWLGRQFSCEHGRQRYQCNECGGNGVCKHGRQRYQCKECGGNGICEHGRERYLCKECGGNGICEHGRQRSTCKECGTLK